MMYNAVSIPAPPVDRWRPEPREYPLQALFAKWALLCGIAGACLFSSVLAGFTCFALLLCIGMTWRRNEPTLSICLALQWAEISAGYLYWCVYGAYPGFSRPGDLQNAVLFSTCGLLALAVGIRVGLLAFKIRPQRVRALEWRDTSAPYPPPPLSFLFPSTNRTLLKKLA